MMVRIIKQSELAPLGIKELRALFNKVSQELIRTEPGSPERRSALASLENIQRTLAARMAAPRPKPPGL